MKRLIVLIALLAACGDDDGGPSADATPPCTLPAEGACEGAVLQQCVNEELVTTDCAAQMGLCAIVGSAHACTNECEQQGVTADGVCTAEGVRRCEVVGGLYKVVAEACTGGTACVQPTGGAAACTADPCFAIGP